jgi:hypothetical protein
MRTIEIPRNTWVEWLDAFSIAHEGWLVSLAVFGPELGAQPEIVNLPLIGVSADRIDDDATVSVSVARSVEQHFTHVIRGRRTHLHQRTPQWRHRKFARRIRGRCQDHRPAPLNAIVRSGRITRRSARSAALPPCDPRVIHACAPRMCGAHRYTLLIERRRRGFSRRSLTTAFVPEPGRKCTS